MSNSDASELLSFDVSAVKREKIRTSLRASVGKLTSGGTELSNFWTSFPSKINKTSARTLVIADLASLAKKYQSQDHHTWIASVRRSQPYFVALVRTKRDEKHADLVDDLVRHSDMRISVCRNAEEPNPLHKCLMEAVHALAPHALLDVRCSTVATGLWMTYGDGTFGFANWNDLGISDVLDNLIIESAVVGDGGATVEFLMRNGELFDIDAESIKAVLDTSHAASIAQTAQSSDKVVGQRVRAARLSAGLSQGALGQSVGIDQAIISKLERGIHRPRIDTLRRIAKGLDLTLAQMLVM